MDQPTGLNIDDKWILNGSPAKVEPTMVQPVVALRDLRDFELRSSLLGEATNGEWHWLVRDRSMDMQLLQKERLLFGACGLELFWFYDGQ